MLYRIGALYRYGNPGRTIGIRNSEFHVEIYAGSTIIQPFCMNKHIKIIRDVIYRKLNGFRKWWRQINSLRCGVIDRFQENICDGVCILIQVRPFCWADSRLHVRRCIISRWCRVSISLQSGYTQAHGRWFSIQYGNLRLSPLFSIPRRQLA